MAGTKKIPDELIEKRKCDICKKELNPSKFYNTNNVLSDGKSSICKICTKNLINYNDMQTVYDVLKGLDIPFLYSYWASCKEKNPDDPFTIYIRIANSKMNEFKTFTWKDSIFEPQVESQKSNTSNINNTSSSLYNFVLTEELTDHWGYGFQPEEYLNFERKYKKLIQGYKEKTALHKERLDTYIVHKVKEEMATAKGDVTDAEKWAKLAQKDATDAKLNVSQLSKSDITGGIDLLPQLVEAVEQYTSVIPLLPKVLEQPYDDADLIIWANVNYLRHLEDKNFIPYKDIWNFYDEMLGEFFKQKGYTEEQIKIEKEKRNNVFRDLGEVYVEPLYENPDDFVEDGSDSDEFV